MQIQHVELPVWANREKSVIRCRVKFADLPVAVPFTASPQDSESHGVAIFTACAAGEYGPVGAYVVPLAQMKMQCQQDINAACRAHIMAGFRSDALGTPHTYPSDETDQLNLSANVLSSLLPDLPADWVTLQACTDEQGEWQYRAHNKEQIRQVGTDGKAAVMANLARKEQLFALIEAAEDEDSLTAVRWPTA